jgi:hypothetical protein
MRIRRILRFNTIVSDLEPDPDCGSSVNTRRTVRISLAGGWGLFIDLDGRDRYRSANFAQGHGYFFGLGVKLDLAGDDEHQAARYGHGTAAHFGVGLNIDYEGKDRYGSKGPFYNGGAAWDGSVALAVLTAAWTAIFTICPLQRV